MKEIMPYERKNKGFGGEKEKKDTRNWENKRKSDDGGGTRECKGKLKIKRPGGGLIGDMR